MVDGQAGAVNQRVQTSSSKMNQLLEMGCAAGDSH